jgi:glycosyltransferase involved in cell wall biosynthesis
VSDAPGLHVLHVCCTDAFAGVERHVSELAVAQLAAGHRVTIVGGDPTRVQAVAGPGVQVLPGRGVVGGVRSLRRLTCLPSIVNVHLTAAEIAVALSPSLRRVPVVSTRHIAVPRGSRRSTRPIVGLARRRVDGQIAVSQFVADQIDGKSTVVLSGVQADPGRVTATERLPVVLVAQRLEREKETDVALRAFAESGLVDLGWRVIVAGRGSLRPQLEALVRALGIDTAVDFLGHRADLFDLMRTAGVLLAPDEDEAFGLSVVEAMARGLPVVAAGSGAHLETVGSTPGAALFAPGDPGDAARLLRELALSEPARDEYGARLQAVQREHFTVEQQARRTDAAYQALL